MDKNYIGVICVLCPSMFGTISGNNVYPLRQTYRWLDKILSFVFLGLVIVALEHYLYHVIG